MELSIGVDVYMKARLLKEKGGKLYSKDVRVEKDPAALKGLLNAQRWEIFKLISAGPTYPADIAKKLGIHEQKVYYHIRGLEESGVIKVINKVEKKGALAKFYAPVNTGFAIDIDSGYEPVSGVAERCSVAVQKFLFPHVANGKLNTVVVVGSPDPHGPHQVRSRDGHYAVELGLFLGCAGGAGRGGSGSSNNSFDVKLDVEIIAEKNGDGNMMLVGGILTNMVTAQVNRHSNVRFLEDDFPYRKIYSEFSHKTYSDDNIGLVSKMKNPSNPARSIILVAGNTSGGTRAAVLALARHADVLLEKYRGEDNWARLVQGFDMDGDGKIDTVRMIE